MVLANRASVEAHEDRQLLAERAMHRSGLAAARANQQASTECALRTNPAEVRGSTWL